MKLSSNPVVPLVLLSTLVATSACMKSQDVKINTNDTRAKIAQKISGTETKDELSLQEMKQQFNRSNNFNDAVMILGKIISAEKSTPVLKGMITDIQWIKHLRKEDDFIDKDRLKLGYLFCDLMMRVIELGKKDDRVWVEQQLLSAQKGNLKDYVILPDSKKSELGLALSKKKKSF